MSSVILNFDVLKFFTYILFFLVTCQNLSFAGVNDSLPFELFKNKFIFYFDRGINATPFDIRNKFEGGVKTLAYKNNVQPTLGFGIGIKGVGLHVGFALPVYFQPEETAGTTDYFDIGLKVNVKQFFIAGHVRRYKGYAIEDAGSWLDTLSTSYPNEIKPETRTFSTSLNMYYFKSKEFNYQAYNGILGHYQGTAGTWYFKATSNLFWVKDDRQGIIPLPLIDSTELNAANEIGAIDAGLVPGYAFSSRRKSWQFGFLVGLGGVIQNNYFKHGKTTNGFTLAPRLDLQSVIGISKPHFFVLLMMDFDIKSLKIQDMTYTQSYYNFKIATGLRFNSKKKAKQKG